MHSYPTESEIEAAANEDFDKIIRSQVKDEEAIREVLDWLIAMPASAVARKKFRRLNQYYKKINPKLSRIYQQMYEDDILSELTSQIPESVIIQTLEQGISLDCILSLRISGIIQNTEIIISGNIRNHNPIKLHLDEMLRYLEHVHEPDNITELEREFRRLNEYFFRLAPKIAQEYAELFENY